LVFFYKIRRETNPDTDMLADLRHWFMSFGKERACYAKAPAFASLRLLFIYTYFSSYGCEVHQDAQHLFWFTIYIFFIYLDLSVISIIMSQ